MTNTNDREQREEEARTAHRADVARRTVETRLAVVAKLRALGAKVEHDAGGRISKVNGYYIPFDIEEDRDRGFRPLRVKGIQSGKLRAKVGGYGGMKQFPQGKAGLNIDGIAEEMLRLATGRARQAEVDQTLKATERRGQALFSGLLETAPVGTSMTRVGGKVVIAVEVSDFAAGRIIQECLRSGLKAIEGRDKAHAPNTLTAEGPVHDLGPLADSKEVKGDGSEG